MVADPPMDGVLLIDKPAGITSAEVVRQIKARVRPARVGHDRTRDRLATGLMRRRRREAPMHGPVIQRSITGVGWGAAAGSNSVPVGSSVSELETAAVPQLTPEMLSEVAARFIGRIVQQ